MLAGSEHSRAAASKHTGANLMSPDELRPWKLVAAFEGGAVHTADLNGRFFVIVDEGTLEFCLDEEELADMELTKAIEFNSPQARAAYLSDRFRIGDDHNRTNSDPTISDDTLQSIQQHFNNLIMSRAGDLVDRHSLKLPDLSDLRAAVNEPRWFPIQGMCGGFKYWAVINGDDAKLITESWSRVVGGSGQRHEITSQGFVLIEEGFV
jgi:hypothetical protein